MLSAQLATWCIAALATAGVILRPLRIPEAVWALGGALALVGLGLLPVNAAWEGLARGLDVYLFLIGMMLLAELARCEGLFEWLAAQAAAHARGSAVRLFALIYIVGTIVTIFLSNDATAVVLTPAVAAVARAARIEQPLPYLLICALIANAASFVLPISNPANLVIYASHLPPLSEWVPRFALPSAVAITVTYGLLRYTQRTALRELPRHDVLVPVLSVAGKLTAAAILITAVVLMTASAMGRQLGLPTCLAGLATLALVAATRRASRLEVLSRISWDVILLVAGLFVLVEALERTGVLVPLSALLQRESQQSMKLTAAVCGIVVAFAANLVNNLPAGLLAATIVKSAAVPGRITSAVLIGVDLGPNLSVTGSLATILWLTALRREGVQVRATEFLRLGLLIMPPALVLALAAAWLAG